MNRRLDGDSLVIHTFTGMYLPKNPSPPQVVELQNNMAVGELVDDLNNRNVGSYSVDNRILQKIQNKE